MRPARFALALAFALAFALPAAAVDPPEAVDVSVAGVRTVDGGIEGALTNRGATAIHDVRLLVDYVYHWPKERTPGDESPGRSWPHVVAGPIAPGESVSIRFVPAEGLPTAPGTFEPKISVLGFKETRSLAP